MVRASEITLQSIRDAAATLDDVVVRTPLLQLRGAEQIWLKPEVLQPVGSFKARGAYYALSRKVERERIERASTLSAGNMSQGLAWSAARLGIPSTAIMPEGAPESKIEKTRSYGAEVEFIPRDEMFQAMDDGRYNERPGFVHPFDDPDVVAGHGTIGLEIAEDLPDVDTILVPVGSGGLLIGIATAVKALQPGVRVIGVQPEGAAGFAASFKAGEPTTVTGSTFVDGAGAPFVMRSMFGPLQELADDCWTVGDDATRAVIRQLALDNKLVAEGAGALSVAAALERGDGALGRTVCIVSGGSIDAGQLAGILEEPSHLSSPLPILRLRSGQDSGEGIEG